MKHFCLFIALFVLVTCSNLHAQLSVTQSFETDAKIVKETKFDSYTLNGNTYFVLKTTESVYEKYNLIAVNGEGTTISNTPLTFDVGTFKNMNSVNGINRIGKSAFVLIENRNKEEGKNTLIMRTLSDKGAVGEVKKEIGFVPYTKMIDPGTWLYYVTSDKQHIAIVGVYPAEKGEPQRGKYYFLDNAFNVVSNGELSIPATEKKKNYFFQLLASDKGDMYLINNDYEKSTYKIPVVYRKLASEKSFTENMVMLKEPYRVFDYLATITETGSLLLGGYTQEKKGSISFGSTAVKGVWFYNSDKPTETSIIDFEKSSSNLKPLGLLMNNTTAFLVGEQVIEKKEPRPAGYMGFDENYTYEYNDILVTGYNTTADTKFDVVLPRKMMGRNFLPDLAPSFGILNEKLCLLYNDDSKKYFQIDYTYKLPVTVFITNDGLMEQPANYQKQFDVWNSGFTLLTNFTHFKSNQLTTLSFRGNAVKAAVLK